MSGEVQVRTSNVQLFRGFIPISGKKAMMPFKDMPSERLLTEDSANRMGDYAAVLADDIVCVDIDDAGRSDKLLNIVRGEKLGCRVYQTSRGKHFLFRNAGRVEHSYTATYLACGLMADIKCGSKNSYIVRKKDGKLRGCIYDAPLEPIPCYLYPMPKRLGRDLENMAEGDGRNTALYTYILNLGKVRFSKTDSKETLDVVNKYVFSKPMSASEMDTITRDDAFGKQIWFDGDGHFMFDQFAKHIATDCHIININGQLMSYDGQSYVPSDAVIERIMIQEVPNLRQSQRKEVLSYLAVYLRDRKDSVERDMVAFSNGLYDIINDRLLPLTPEVITTNPIPHNYKREAYSPIGDKFLTDVACGDPQLRLLLEEVLGFSFLRYNELRKSFLLFGGKHNGKSTFLDIIVKMLGESNVSSLDLKDIGERFKTAELYSKLANIGDDIDDDFIRDLSLFKKVVSGDRLNAERKNRDPFDFNPYAKLFFSANSMPRLKDRTGAVMERLVIIPFLAEFDSSNPDYDPFIKYKLRKEDCIEYFIRVGIEGLRRVLANEGFTECAKVNEAIRLYDMENDSVVAWLTMVEPMVKGHSVTECYNDYRFFCTESSLMPIAMLEFSRQIRRRLGLVTKTARLNGRPAKIYVDEEPPKEDEAGLDIDDAANG